MTEGTSGNIEIAADKIINEQRTVTRSKDVRVNDGMFSGHTERVYYEEIQSGGNLSGGNVTLRARSSITNRGGDIAAEDTVKLSAPVISNEAQVGSEVITWRSTTADKLFGNENTYSAKPLFEGASISGNNVEITSPASLTGGANGTISITDSNLAAGNDVNLNAKNVNIQNGLYTDTVNTTGGSVFAGLGAGYVVAGASGFTSEGSYQGLTPSTLMAGNQININGSQSVGIKASELQAGESINVNTPNLSISGEYQRSNSENYGANAYVLIGPSGPIGGGVGANGGYERSGQYFTASLNANEVNLNSPNQQLDGVRINNKDINPHSDYHEGHQFSGGIGFGGGTASINSGFDDFSIAAGTGQSSFASVGYKEFNVGSNIGQGANGNERIGVFASAYGFGGGLGRTNIDKHPDLIDFSFGYGPLAFGGAAQGGELKGVSATAGFWTGQTQISPIDWTCFKAGTKVKLADLKEINIENIKAGDSVKAYDETSGEFINAKVKQVFERSADSYFVVKLQNGEVIEVTEEHPFFTDKGWTATKELKPGTLIKTINGFISVQSIKQVNERTKVYNFEVEGFHTYLVGSAGLVVHNDCIYHRETGKLEFVADGYIPQAGEVKLTEEETQAIAFSYGLFNAFLEDQKTALLFSSDLFDSSQASFPGMERLSYQSSLWVDSWLSPTFAEPIDPVDLRSYRAGELFGHTGTLFLGNKEMELGTALSLESGVLLIVGRGQGVQVAAAGALTGAAIATHGFSTTVAGSKGFAETLATGQK